MNTHADETQENKSQTVTAEASQIQSGGESTFQFVDNRPEAIAQRKLQEMANNSPQVSQLRAFQDMANNSPQAKQTAQLKAMADNYSAQQQQPIQKKENNTGLPDNLKTGMENLSGMSLDDVKVHRNSDKPAQLQAHAYAQGTDIHLGAGQEKHLPHEAWHVVQQKQGRVKPTMQLKGKVNINNDASLEKEADVMGTRVLQKKSLRIEKQTSTIASEASGVTIQRAIDINSLQTTIESAKHYKNAMEYLPKLKKLAEVYNTLSENQEKSEEDKLTALENFREAFTEFTYDSRKYAIGSSSKEAEQKGLSDFMLKIRLELQTYQTWMSKTSGSGGKLFGKSTSKKENTRTDDKATVIEEKLEDGRFVSEEDKENKYDSSLFSKELDILKVHLSRMKKKGGIAGTTAKGVENFEFQMLDASGENARWGGGKKISINPRTVWDRATLEGALVHEYHHYLTNRPLTKGLSYIDEFVAHWKDYSVRKPGFTAQDINNFLKQGYPGYYNEWINLDKSPLTSLNDIPAEHKKLIHKGNK